MCAKPGALGAGAQGCATDRGLAIRGPGRGPVTANPSKRFAVKFAEASSFCQAVQSARRGWGVAEGRPLRDLLVMYSRSHTGVELVRHATEPPPLGRSYLWTHGDLHLLPPRGSAVRI